MIVNVYTVVFLSSEELNQKKSVKAKQFFKFSSSSLLLLKWKINTEIKLVPCACNSSQFSTGLLSLKAIGSAICSVDTENQ